MTKIYTCGCRELADGSVELCGEHGPDAMTVYVIVGRNGLLDNVSARAVYSQRADADAHLTDPARMWFDDKAVVVALELDREVGEQS